MNADEFFADREASTASTVQQLSQSFEKHLQADGVAALARAGCAYVVGSAGRGELNPSSDLDLFLVTHDKPRRVHEILAQAAVIRMMADHKLPEPSNDGLFLRLYAAEDIERRLGAVQDDPENTFTARMLLLLESRPLYGHEAYDRLVERALNAYWRNVEGHEKNYLPMVLVNDVVRYWRVVVLNYEAKFERKRLECEDSDAAREGLEAEKRFASFKMRFARCMTCYSTIARLLAETAGALNRTPHVSLDVMREIVRSTPVQRLQQVRAMAQSSGQDEAVTTVDALLDLYREYIELRDRGDSQVKALFPATEEGRRYFTKADRFGSRMFDLLQQLGASSPLYRYVVA